MIPHYILTRSIYDPAICDPDMVARRLEIFASVTVPSLQAQTSQRATWVIAVHPDDPHLIERRALADSSGLYAVFVPMPSGETPRLSARLPYSHDWGLPDDLKLTTRLDDDDALLPTFCERLYERVPATTEMPQAFMFPEGYRIRGDRWAPYRHPRNMFVSVLTPAGDKRNVCNWWHMDLPDEMPTIDVDQSAAWVFFRHPDTISNHDPVTRPLAELADRLPFKVPA